MKLLLALGWLSLIPLAILRYGKIEPIRSMIFGFCLAWHAVIFAKELEQPDGLDNSDIERGVFIGGLSVILVFFAILAVAVYTVIIV